MTDKHPKRPRDLNQWAKRMLDIATGEASDAAPTPAGPGDQTEETAKASKGERPAVPPPEKTPNRKASA